MRKALLVAGALVCLARVTLAAPAERYLHVKVDNATKGEMVRVSVPMSLAEKVLSSIDRGNLHSGKISICEADVNGVDIRKILDALRTAPDNEFVTVKEPDQEVRVAKSGGNLLVHVRELNRSGEKADITVPMTAMNALLIPDSKELDLIAALRALGDAGEAFLVTFQDDTQNVRIWVDAKNNSE